MARQVIVCDDNAITRSALVNAIKTIDGVTVKELDHPQHLIEVLASNPETAVLLMDLEFPDPPGSKELSVIGHKLLPDIRQKFPGLKVIVVTHLAADQVYDIVLECNRRRLQDDWIDIGKAFKNEEVRARVEALVFPFGDLSSDGLWIVQMSDLHFGNSVQFEYWGLGEDGALARALLRDFETRIAKDYDIEFRGADLLLLTGDVVDKGRDTEFVKGYRFVKDVTDHCFRSTNVTSGRLAESRVLVIPGNHDANFDISRARCIMKTAKTSGYSYHEPVSDDGVPSELRYLKKYIWAPFDEFQRHTKCAQPTFDRLWNLGASFAAAAWLFPEFRGVIYGVNTAARCTHLRNEPGVDQDVVLALKDFADSFLARQNRVVEPEGFPRVLMAHHSLGSAESGANRVNDTEIGSLRKALHEDLGVSVFLTGHVHREICELISVGTKALLFVGAGSAAAGMGQQVPMEPLSYNLINIKPRDCPRGIGPIVTVFPRLLIGGAFAKNPHHEKLTYRWDDDGGWVFQRFKPD